MTQRGLDTTSFTERGALSAGVYTARSISTSTYTQRGAVTSTQIIPPWDDPDDEFPEISNVHCNKLGATEVELDWDTNEPANCQVRYSTLSSMTTYTEGPQHEHYVSSDRSYLLTGLSGDTTYYFRIVAYDRTGNGVTSIKYSFKTADSGKSGTPPSAVIE